MDPGAMTGILSAELLAKARQVLERCGERKIMLALAESCTGGLVAASLTSLAGSSTVVERGFVTYSNEAKTDLLGVPADLIGRVGAVSPETARAMAEGALARSRAQASLAITGIAGPGGGSPEKPVGTVHLAAALSGRTTLHQHCQFDGTRDAVRLAAALAAMDLILTRLAG
jgi:nicotinamide-nucleotide amidase